VALTAAPPLFFVVLQPFGGVCELIPLAEHVTKLHAVCATCGHDAPFSKRITNETAVEVIGDSDKYIPVCRTCFHLTPLAIADVYAAVTAAETEAVTSVALTHPPATPVKSAPTSGAGSGTKSTPVSDPEGRCMSGSERSLPKGELTLETECVMAD
jgi:hypothetical protein